MKNILITGATGVIGLNLIKHYSAKNLNSDLFHIAAVSKREMSLVQKKYFSGPNVTFYHSVSELSDNHYDYIFNCGGPSQPALFTSNPKLVIDANITEIPEILKKLSTRGTFVQMGTSEIYSGCLNLPCTEEHRGSLDADNPRRTYVLAKELAEVILRAYASPEQRVLALRVSLVYGPGAGLSDSRVLYELIKKGLSGEILLEGAADTIRRYLYVDDFIFMIQNILNSTWRGFNIFNLGGIEPMTIQEMAEKIGALTGSPVRSKLVKDNRSLGAPREVWVSLEKFQKLFPDIKIRSFSEGLIPTIDWTRNLLESAQ